MSNSMLAEIESLPALVHAGIGLARDAVAALPIDSLARIRRLVVTGCGDSFFAGLATRQALERATGGHVEALTSLHVGRFGADGLTADDPGATAVVALSVSGSSSRTVEALDAARRAGVVTIALTAKADSPLTAVADHQLVVPGPPWTDPEPTTTPGVRSWALNLLVLLALGEAVGTARRHLAGEAAARFRAGVDKLAPAVEAAVEGAAGPARELAEALLDAPDADVLGGGPHLGTAHFTAAKLIEACGDRALGQDLEEWAHLQFCTRSPALTVVVASGQHDVGRAAEVLRAAQEIGRQTVCILPSDVRSDVDATTALCYPAGVEPALSPMVAAVPGQLYAAHRGELLGETYFRVDRPITTSRIRVLLDGAGR